MTNADLNGLSDGGENLDLKKASEYTNIPPVKKCKEAKDLGPAEIAEMVFDMMISHRIMETRIEKLESILLNIPQADKKLSEYMMKAGTVEGRLQKIENRLNLLLSKELIKKDTVEGDTVKS